MSNIWNPHAFGVTGQPVGPQVNTLRVYGAEPSKEQLAMAQQTFAKFCMTERLSFAPNQTQQGFLPDGSKYRIVVVGNTRIMEVRPVGSEESVTYTYGFLFAFFPKNYGALDAVVAGGTHTGAWRGVVITTDEYTKLHRGNENFVLRPSIKGAGTLPYSFLGNTFGLALFDLAAIEYRSLFAFGDKKAYSLSADRVTKKIVCTISTLTSNPAPGSPAPQLVSETSVDVGDFGGYWGYYDWNFAGTQVLLQAPNKKIVTEVLVDAEREEYYKENTGLSYAGDYSFFLPILNAEYDGPDKYKVYSRSGTSFSMLRDISLPPDTVSPPLEAHRLITPTKAIPFFGSRSAAINLVITEGEQPKGTWTITGLEWVLVGWGWSTGSWRGHAIQNFITPSDFSGQYEHTRYSFKAPPKFDFGGTTTDLVVKNVYKYKIACTGNLRQYSEGTHWGGDVYIGDDPGEKERSKPAGYGTFDLARPDTPIEWWTVATHETGTRTTTETSSCKITTDIFGREFTLRDSAAEVTIVVTSDSVTGYGIDPSLMHGDTEGELNYFSRTLIRDILVYDPHLSLLCYTEHESTLRHTLNTEYHSVYSHYDGSYGYMFDKTATSSPGPKYDDIVVTKHRFVIEQHGVIRHAVDIIPNKSVASNAHAMGLRVGFNEPSVSLSSPPDDTSRVIQVSSPGISPKGRDITIVSPVSAVFDNISAPVDASVQYRKSPATGAAILTLNIQYPTNHDSFAITSKGIKPLPSALLEAGMAAVTADTWTAI